MKTHETSEHLSPATQGQEMILAHVGDSRAVLCQQGRAVRDLAVAPAGRTRRTWPTLPWPRSD